MKKTKLEYETAREQIDSFTYGLLYLTDGIRWEKNPAASKIDWEKCYEARFFLENKELHIFERNDRNQAILVEDGANDTVTVRGYKLSAKYSSTGKTLLVKEYLEFDEDGQAYVALTRLCGVK